MKTERYFILSCPYDPHSGPSEEFENVIAELDDLTAEEAEQVVKATELSEASPYPEDVSDVTVWCESESTSRNNMASHLLRRRRADAIREALSDPDTDYDQRHYRFARCAVWCAEELRKLRTQDTTRQSKRRFEVHDTTTGKTLLFDANNTTQWGPVNDESEQERKPDGMPMWDIKVTLYRHIWGHWTKLDESTSRGQPERETPTVTRISDAEAADWLVRNDFPVPKDISHLADAAFFTPGPPATKNDKQPMDLTDEQFKTLVNPPDSSLDAESLFRPAYRRDHEWLKWVKDKGMTPAKIRNFWNGMSDEERRQICPSCSDKIGGTDSKGKKAGLAVVKEGVKKAKKERDAQTNQESIPGIPGAIPGRSPLP